MSAKALKLYANDPTNPEAKAAKKALLKSNKHVLKYLTGQKKMKGTFCTDPNATPTAVEAAEMYIVDLGMHAWRSVSCLVAQEITPVLALIYLHIVGQVLT